ncbi:MAG: RDD family protein [Devosiaceae bacterium]|nr:RDD family protein [Devosiaceae bacterium MH13]
MTDQSGQTPPILRLDPSQSQGDTFAFDPVSQPWLFDGVRTRRIFAFLLDVVVLGIFIGLGAFVVGLLGILTFGLGWLLYLVLAPAVAIAYIGLTMGGPKSATPGMQAMGIEMRLWHGGRMHGLIAIVHALIFYFSVGTGLLWFIILGASLFSSTKRCLHDVLLGTVVINGPARAASLKA